MASWRCHISYRTAASLDGHDDVQHRPAAARRTEGAIPTTVRFDLEHLEFDL